MLGEIKNNLAENYRGDDNVLQQIINDVTSQALFISNRKDVDILKPEIKRCFPKRAKNIRKEPKKSEVIYSRPRRTIEG